MERFNQLRGIVRDVILPVILALVAMLHVTPKPPTNMPPPPPPPPTPTLVFPMPIPGLPVPPAPKFDPAGATVRLRMGNIGCTATVLSDRPGPGKYYVLSANHCVKKGGAGTVTLSDGRSFKFNVVRTNATADLSLLMIEAPDGLPVAQVAMNEPGAGVGVWHQGYGVDRPGNRETGTVKDGKPVKGQLAMVLSVSSGDSGSGIFRTDTNQLVAVVCCTNGRTTWGGSVTEIRKLLQGMDGTD